MLNALHVSKDRTPTAVDQSNAFLVRQENLLPKKSLANVRIALEDFCKKTREEEVA